MAWESDMTTEEKCNMEKCESLREIEDDTKSLNRNVVTLATQLTACVSKLDQIVVLLQGPLTGGTGLVHDVAVLKQWRDELDKMSIFDMLRAVRQQTKMQWVVGSFIAAQLGLFIVAVITGKVSVVW